jgi:predicted RNase H-like nuclease (RuvC/YqgF family)
MDQPLSYPDIVQAVTAAVAPIQSQLVSLQNTVEKLRDESAKQITRQEVERLTTNLQSRELAEQRYQETKAFQQELETRFATLEAKAEHLQQTRQQSWQTIALLVGGWLFMVILQILTKVIH